MAIIKKSPILSGVDGRHVDALARRVIAELRNKPPKEFRERVAQATGWLIEKAMSNDIFILEDARSELMARGLSAADIVDHCVSDAAREMGRQWADDEASFATVTLGTARLHGLCKLLTSDWENPSNLKPNASVLIAVCDREDHLIGPVVLADQVRRAGYSVHLMTRAVPEKLLSKLTSEPFATVFVSCSAEVSLENVATTVRHVRAKMSRSPRFVLGGPVIDCVDDLLERTGVDLVTNSIGLALADPGRSSEMVANC
ncbi:cobalamin-dependent protein [Sulfitobacter sp. LCG007]